MAGVWPSHRSARPKSILVNPCPYNTFLLEKGYIHAASLSDKKQRGEVATHAVSEPRAWQPENLDEPNIR